MGTGTNEESKKEAPPEYAVFYSSAEDDARQIAVKVCQEWTGKREIERPKIERSLIISGLLIPIGLIVAIVLVMVLTTGSFRYAIGAGLLIPLLLLLKYVAFLWIKLYQKFAPEKIRQSCLFYPSCSQYMFAFKTIIDGAETTKIYGSSYVSGGYVYQKYLDLTVLSSLTMAPAMIGIIGGIVMAIVNHIYFKNRELLFVN